MKGRKPIPAKVKIARGNPGHQVINILEPDANGAPDPPKTLSAEERKIWNRIVPALDDMGILATADRDQLEQYCRAVALYDMASAKVAKDGATQMTPQGVEIPSAWLQIANKQAEIIRKIGAVFGMSPSDRCRLSVAPKKTPADTLRDFIDSGDSSPESMVG